jgi:hypothetical protein
VRARPCHRLHNGQLVIQRPLLALSGLYNVGAPRPQLKAVQNYTASFQLTGLAHVERGLGWLAMRRNPRCAAPAFNLSCPLIGLVKDAASGMGRAWSVG